MHVTISITFCSPRSQSEAATHAWVLGAARRLGGVQTLQAQVARLAREGLSNPEIGARLFISSRRQLHRVLSVDPDTLPPR